MGLNRLEGTPWHLEKYCREDGDERRYKGRCKYYNFKDEHCRKRYGRCVGSAHCNWYERISDEEFASRQRNINKANYRKNKKTASNDDEIYWYN